MVNPALTPNIGGQIVRIYLENFMTYDVIEIRPGFHLNMIIGPNGTGKSTIVCAVVLGLGGKLKTLGRADQLSSYVKSGCDQSLIEIELFRENCNNVVIRRQISTTNDSNFFIDGKPVKAVRVTELRQELNIQVDNLCTFLPQEKLHDFAKMNPQQLLEHTLRTVDGGELLKKHENLRTLRSDMSSCENDKQRQEEIMKTEEAKNERLLGKVQAIKEKTALCEKVTLLSQKKAWLVYHDAIEKKKDIEKDVNLARKNLEAKSKELDLVAKEIKKIEDESRDKQEACSAAKREEVGKRSAVEDRLERLRRRVDQLADLKSHLTAMLEEEKNKKKELRRHQAALEKLNSDLQSLDSTSLEEIQAEDMQLTRQQRDCHEQEAKLRRKLYTIEEQLRNLKNELRSVGAQCRLLENSKAQRLAYLKNFHPSVYEAVQWVEANQNLFSGKVYNPMLLELNVPDPKMAKYVESVISPSDLIAFTATSSSDMNLLIQKLRVEKKLQINVVTSKKDHTQFSPNIPMSRLKVYGFFAYISDLVVGPDAIMRYLCRNYQIHNIPVGNATTTAKCDEVPDSLHRYFCEVNSYSVRVSAYSGERATIVKKIGGVKFFEQSVDTAEIARLKNREREIQQNIAEEQTGIAQVEKDQEQLKNRLEDIRRRRRELSTRLDEKEQIKEQIKRATITYERCKQSIRAPADIHAEFEAQKKSQFEGIIRGLEELRKAHDALDQVFIKCCRASLLLKASRAGLEELKERRTQTQENLRQAQEAMRMVDERRVIAEARCRQAQTAAKELTNGLGPQDTKFRQLQRKFDQLKNTIAEIEAELEEAQARADFLDGGSAQVVQEYNLREEEIIRVRAMVEKASSDLIKIGQKVDDTRDAWLQPLNDLIKQINERFEHYFASMGCEGEVCLLVPEDKNDFDNYGISIRVKFREGAPLQELSRHFQSGGERAVTTAIYMLSLQHLANVPFRFVDEINQGMDPANERRITELIVKVTTPKDSSQYFFITPKLLPDLECADTMSVLCVYNGPKAILASDWSLSKFLRRARGDIED